MSQTPEFRPPTAHHHEREEVLRAANSLGDTLAGVLLLGQSESTAVAAVNLAHGIRHRFALTDGTDDRARRNLDAAELLVTLADAIRREADVAARAARMAGARWHEIGHAMGVSESRAQQRYGSDA